MWLRDGVGLGDGDGVGVGVGDELTDGVGIATGAISPRLYQLDLQT